MDFFQQQERAQKKTGLLVTFFVLAVIGIIIVLGVICALVLDLPWTDPELWMWVGGGVLVLVSLGTLTKMAELSSGGRVVAAMLGGEPIHPNTKDLNETKLLNIVEEMSIASGVPVPEVYLLPDPAINAFAAGHGPGDTVIGVTRGCIERLTRDELQGVIAHEFSHILHGDMKLNIRLIGLLHGILCIALLGSILLRATFFMPSGGGSSSENRKSGAGIVLVLIGLGLALYLVGWIGVFFGNLIKAAVSRQREFLADASAVQYTRNPQGIAGALYKIGRFTGRLMSPRASEASHMYFGNGMGDGFFSLFATHPPIPDRIKAIAPNFDPSTVDTTPPKREIPVTQPPPIPQGRPVTASGIFQLQNQPPVGFAAALIAALPEFSRSAVRELHAAMAITLALVLDDDDSRREAQIQALQIPDSLRADMLRFFAKRDQIKGPGRIAVIDLAIPTLRTLSHEQYTEFRANVQRLIESDRQIDFFEFILQKTLIRHLDLYFLKITGPSVKYRSLAPLYSELETVLGTVAIVGTTDPDQRRKAFATGVRELLFKPSDRVMEAPETIELATLDQALDKLAEATPDVKRTVLNACLQIALDDQEFGQHEYEVIRAIADTLDCPMPPIPEKVHVR